MAGLGKAPWPMMSHNALFIASVRAHLTMQVRKHVDESTKMECLSCTGGGWQDMQVERETVGIVECKAEVGKLKKPKVNSNRKSCHRRESRQHSLTPETLLHPVTVA